MAVEVTKRTYVFETSPSSTKPHLDVDANLLETYLAGDLDTDPDVDESHSPMPLGSDETEKANGKTASKTFRYNVLHDLESLWWIAVYFIVKKHTAVDNFPRLPSDRMKLLIVGAELFGNRTGRHAFLTSLTECKALSNIVAPALHPAIAFLDNIRQALVAAYQDVECWSTPEVILDQKQSGLYSYVGTMFQRIANIPDACKISLWPMEEILPDTNVTPETQSPQDAESTDTVHLEATSPSHKRVRDDAEPEARGNKRFRV